MIIALDGPAGSGKSTIAKLVAKELNINYLDTGAMYRMVTLYFLNNKLNLNDENVVNDNLCNISIFIKSNSFFLNGENVDEKIRSVEVTRNVSLAASYRKVREFLVEQQRLIAKSNSCILDGRDIGSVVFPNADYKFFMTATPETRARRRFLQGQDTNVKQTEEEILKDIIERDLLDTTRKESPLIQTSDAIVIDSSYLSIEDTIKEITKKIKR
jgi:cytidylate kinase